MLRKSLYSAVIITAFLLFATASIPCVGDESCRSAVEDFTSQMYEPDISYDKDGKFLVVWYHYGEEQRTSYGTDCDCNVTHIDGRKRD